MDKKPKTKSQRPKAKDQKPKTNISPARLSVFEILLKVEKEKAFTSVLLPLYEKNLAENDRALCHELTLGILRKQIYLDKIIEIFTTKKLDLEVRIALRIGLYQLLFLDKIPAYSAINESVNLVAIAKKTSAKGFVNAILRRVSREKIELNFADEIEQISVETSHPRWLIKKWISQFGIEETKKLAVANNETPGLDFRFTAKTTEKTRRRGDVETRRELFELAEKGEIYFQDKASQMVAEIIELKEDERFLDMCCAPGSKLSLIAVSTSPIQNPQSKIQNLTGGDLHFHRLQISKESCRRQGLKNVRLLQYDAENALPFADETFDVILLDAPCSGTGTIRHNPEIRYHLNEKDFAELSTKQLKILNNASKILKRGGRLIYSTCSLEIEENENVIENFLAENKGFSKQKIKLPANFLTEKDFARTFPQRDKMDGFFIVSLKKS